MRLSLVVQFLVFKMALAGISQSQSKVDSLKQISVNQSPEEKTITYNLLSDLLLYSNPDESLVFAKKSLAIAIETDDYSGQLSAYNNIG